MYRLSATNLSNNDIRKYNLILCYDFMNLNINYYLHLSKNCLSNVRS